MQETAHLWQRRQVRAYKTLVLGSGISATDRTANAAALNQLLVDAAGGILSLPAGEIIEVDGSMVIPGDITIKGNGATIVDRGAIANRRLFNPSTSGLSINIYDLTLQGHTEAEVTAAGDTGVIALACVSNTNLAIRRVIFTDFFGNCIQGSVGSNIDIDNCTFQSWNSHGAGGDGTRGWVVRNSTFGRIGSGSNLDHHLYINPDVWLYLDNCEFLVPVGDAGMGWSIHYYGTDEGGPYRTPIFKDCYFERKVFTCETALTIVDDCHFETRLQVQNDTQIKGGYFGPGASLHYRTGGARFIRINSTSIDCAMNCEAANPSGTVYLFRDCRINGTIVNRARPANHIEVRGGLWESGALDIGNGTAHLDGRLRMSNTVTKFIHTNGVLTEGEVVYY